MKVTNKISISLILVGLIVGGVIPSVALGEETAAPKSQYKSNAGTPSYKAKGLSFEEILFTVPFESTEGLTSFQGKYLMDQYIDTIIEVISQMSRKRRAKLPINPTFKGNFTPYEIAYMTKKYRSALDAMDAPRVHPGAENPSKEIESSVPSLSIFGAGNTGWLPVKGGGYSVTNLKTGRTLAVSDEGNGSYAAIDLNSGERYAIDDHGDGTFSILELK